MTQTSPRRASSRIRAVGFGKPCMWQLWDTTGFVPRNRVIVARSKSMLWKSHPTPAISRRTTG